MAVLSVGNSTLSNFALFGIAQASRRLEDSTLKLATNNRLIRASTDPAGMSIATQLRASVAAMKQAQQNSLQATSMMQVAADGLNGISDTLTSMLSLAGQANSASLTPADRAALDLQFQSYRDQIDQLSANTSFNGIKLLDGSATDENVAATKTNNATQATGSINFAANIAAGKTIVLNGVTFTEGAQFAAGGTIQASLDNLVNALSTSTNTAISQANYQRIGNSVQITAKAGGTLGNQYQIRQDASTAVFTTTGSVTNIANRFTLQGGANDGLNATSVKATGSIGDTLITAQNQVSATSTLTVSGVISAGEQLRIDDGNGGLINFTFVAAPVAATDIGIGANVSDTLANAAAVISRYSAANDYGVRQLEVRHVGNTLSLTNKTTGNATDLPGAALDVAETLANGTLSNASLNNGATGGVDVSGVNNASFYGQVQGFSATYTAPNQLTASLTVGGSTYTSTITNTAPGANTTARFSSTNGGYFDVQLSGGAGMAVANQANADLYADRLDAAFSTLNFSQNRFASSYSAAGQLTSSSIEFRTDDFSDNLTINDINVIASPGVGLDATVEIEINGETYRSGQIGNNIGDFETITLTNISNSNRQITFRNGINTIDLSNQANADTFEANLKTAFSFGTGGGALKFQVGENVTDTISARIGNVNSNKLFNGATPDLSSQANAAAAQAIVQTAIDTVTSESANVGAIQSRLDTAYNTLGSSIPNVDAARSAIEDTDIASESTEFAVATVMLQAGISVLAQTNSLQSSMLTLLDPKN